MIRVPNRDNEGEYTEDFKQGLLRAKLGLKKGVTYPMLPLSMLKRREAEIAAGKKVPLSKV